MKHLKSILLAAAALALPLSVVGGESAAVDQSESAVVPATIEVDGQTLQGNGCCWMYVNGRWWCVPCG